MTATAPWRKATFSRSHESPGFTLLEVLVALAVLSISLGVLFGAFSSGAVRARQAHSELLAADAAATLLARIGRDIPLAVGETGGRLDGAIDYHLSIRPSDTAVDRRNRPIALLAVTLDLSWPIDGRPARQRFETLRFVPRSSP